MQECYVCMTVAPWRSSGKASYLSEAQHKISWRGAEGDSRLGQHPLLRIFFALSKASVCSPCTESMLGNGGPTYDSLDSAVR